jgi:hypothetical protein
MFAVTVCHCQAQTVRWKFERQVVDQQGVPLTNATVEVSGHERSLTSLYAQKDRILHTDKKGMFAIDRRAETLCVTITNAGFVHKRLILVSGLVDVNAFPPTGKIVLTRARPLPRLDDLDKLGSETLEVNNFKHGSTVWISFRPERVHTAPDANALIRVERGTNGFRITCQAGTQGKAVRCEPGLDVETWRSSNAFADETGMSTEFMCIGNDTCGFLLKTSGYWVLGMLGGDSRYGNEDVAVSYTLSRDNVFGTEDMDED